MFLYISKYQKNPIDAHSKSLEKLLLSLLSSSRLRVSVQYQINPLSLIQTDLRWHAISVLVKANVYTNLHLTMPHLHFLLFPDRYCQNGLSLNLSLFTARKRSLGQGNIFTSVCQKFCSQGTTPLHAGIPPQPGKDTPLGRQTPPGRQTPLHSACWEKWSTSGRYASYWNAILFFLYFHKIEFHSQELFC